MNFAKTPSSIKEIYLSYFRLYFKAILGNLPFILMTGLAINTFTLLNYTYRTNGIDSKLTGLLLPVFILLIMPYLISLLLLKTYHIGKEQKTTLKDMVLHINKKYFKILVSTTIVFFTYSIGMRLLVFPGIFGVVLLIVVQPLVLLDNQGIVRSLVNSCKLVWGNWWRTFAIIFPLLIINYWTSYAIVTAFQSNQWRSVATNGLLSALFFSLLYASVLVIYNDLKLRKNKEKGEAVIVTAAY